MDVLIVVIGIVGVVGTFLCALYARRQWRDGRQHLPAPDPAVTVAASSREQQAWYCAIYDYPPLSSFSDVSSVPTGLLAEFASEIFQKLGTEITFKRFDYEEIYVVERIPDAVIGMFDTTIRRKKLAFSRPIYTIGLQGICRIDQSGDILQDLHAGKLRVAVYFGEVGWEYLEDTLPEITKSRAAILHRGTQLDTMALLSQRTYDVVLMDELACVNFLRGDGYARDFRLAFERPLRNYHACIAVRLDHADRLDEIDREIVRVRNSRWYLNEESAALAGFEEIVRKFH